MSRRKQQRQEEIRTLMPATDDHGTLRRLAVRANLVWLAGHQRDVAAREAGTGKALTGMPVHRSTAPTLPGALNGPDLSGDIARKLTALVQELVLERDWTPTAEGEADRWMQAARRWDQELWTEREVLDWYDDTTELRRRAERVLGPDAHGRWLGPCPVPDCVGEVRMGDDQAAAVCAECGGFVTRGQQRQFILEEFDDRLMSRSELATALVTVGADVPYSSLCRWIATGALPEHIEWQEWMGFPFIAPPSGLYWFRDAFTRAAKRATRVRVEGSAA
jgi:hypothetical protein